MQRLKDIFNSAQVWDHVEGAVMGMSAGYLFTAGQLPGLVAGGILGLVTGGQRLTQMFNAAVRGREMAFDLIPAPARSTPKP